MRRLATSPDRVDWFRILADLRRAGYPTLSVAKLLRIPYSTIHGWKLGAEPKHVDGERVLVLWAGVVQRDKGEAPTMGQALASQRAALQG